MSLILRNISNNKNFTLRMMHKYLFIFLYLFSFALTSSTAQARSEESLWRSGFDYISLMPADKGGSSNNHPVEFTQQEVYEILSSIFLTDADNSVFDLDFLDFFSDENNEYNKYRLFSRSELTTLSKYVSSGLSAANSQQDIVFSITGRHEKTFGKGSLTTSGRIFFSEGSLNLIIGELRVNIEKKYRMQGGYSDIPEKVDYLKLKTFRLDTGSRSSESDLDYHFATDDIHQLKSYNNKVRNDWLLVDVGALQKVVLEKRDKEQRKESIVEETVDLKQQTSEIDREQEQLKEKVERLERLVEAKEKARSSAPAQGDTSMPSRSIEERLTELKQLLEKDIISEEIYNEKMKDILDEL